MGLLETLINGDTTAAGERVNPHRIYALQSGEFYIMKAPIIVDNPDGTLSIRAEEGDGPKPFILLNAGGNDFDSHRVNGSHSIQGIQYHNRPLDYSSPPYRAWRISGEGSKLLVEDCFFESGRGELFSASDVQTGLVAVLRNNYFRDFHDGQQWWAGRILACRVPVDTLIFENNTTTG